MKTPPRDLGDCNEREGKWWDRVEEHVATKLGILYEIGVETSE